MSEKPPGSTLKKIFVGAGVAMLAFVALLVVVAIWFADAPATHVQAGNRLPAEYRRTAQELGALGRAEKAVFFYAPGIEMRDEFVMVTDSRVALYGEEFSPKLSQVLFNEVGGVILTRDTSFAGDSSINLELLDGGRFSFVVASEGDGDIRVRDYLEQQVALARAQQEEMAARRKKAEEVAKEREDEAHHAEGEVGAQPAD